MKVPRLAVAPLVALLGACGALGSGAHPQSVKAEAQTCTSMTSLSPAGATVTSAAYVDSSTSPAYQGVTEPFTQPFCRVQLTSTPAPDADIKFEVWLPSSTAWNGKFLGTGNGGYAGKIVYSALANGLERGYVVANTDAGTHATTGFIQMAGKPELQKNYEDRAIHLMTLSAKSVLKEFYQRTQDFALFAGCSTGGYEAMTEAQKFPSDYNGIVAGAPGIDFGGLGLFQGNSYVATHATSDSAIPAKKLPAILTNVIKQCDAADGLADGQIDDPSKCKANLEPLLCFGAENDSCLTRPQITALTRLQNGPLNPRTGQRYYPVFPAGAEGSGGAVVRIANSNTGSTITDASPGPLSWVLPVDWTPNQWLAFNFDTDALNALAAYAPKAPSNPDLTAFKNAGGKLMIFHGWGDANIFAESTVSYYKSVQAMMGVHAVRQFSRLFLVPGMDHCSGGAGPAPNTFGQVNWKMAANSSHDTDIIAALDRWVAAGIAPERFIATKYTGNNPQNAAIRTRPVCQYPEVARYVGGSIDKAENFVCASP